MNHSTTVQLVEYTNWIRIAIHRAATTEQHPQSEGSVSQSAWEDAVWFRFVYSWLYVRDTEWLYGIPSTKISIFILEGERDLGIVVLWVAVR